MELFNNKYLNFRSQDLEPAFHDAGQYYFFVTNTILEKRKLWTDNTGVIEINEMEGQDIDNGMDWRLAELKYQIQNTK
jgi:N-acylneuraminate cytidylyltransferase